METAGQRAFYLCISFLQMLRAAFCLPAVPAERNREKEPAQIGYKLWHIYGEPSSLPQKLGNSARWGMNFGTILSLDTRINGWGRALRGKLEGEETVLDGRWHHKQVFLFKECFKTGCWDL